MTIYTSCFSKQKKEEVKADRCYASIAVGRPKFDLPFHLDDITSIKPYGIFGKYNGEEYKEKYFERLNKIGVLRIFEELKEVAGGKKEIVLMCYETDAYGCHRRMFAEWWLHQTGEIIEEL